MCRSELVFEVAEGVQDEICVWCDRLVLRQYASVGGIEDAHATEGGGVPLLYQKNNQKSLLFGNENCQHRFRTNPDVGDSIQLKFVNRTPPHRRNRLKIGANFVATT